MNIRNATYHDAPAIKLLLEALGYTTRIGVLVNQLEMLFGKEDHQVYVYELRKEVVGFVSVHFMPQLAFDGGLVLITYLSVDDTVKEQGIARALEQYVAEQARKRKCDRIQVHCADWRVPAHQFYAQQGYREYPKYFTKRLVYGE
jgi:N-acetylglutamate synthase-like GNAT family acetyltransferase